MYTLEISRSLQTHIIVSSADLPGEDDHMYQQIKNQESLTINGCVRVCVSPVL